MSKFETKYLVSCLPYGCDHEEHFMDAIEYRRDGLTLAEAKKRKQELIKREAKLGENADSWIFKVEVVE